MGLLEFNFNSSSSNYFNFGSLKYEYYCKTLILKTNGSRVAFGAVPTKRFENTCLKHPLATYRVHFAFSSVTTPPTSWNDTQ